MEKLKIIKYAEECGSNRQAADKFGCNESNVRAWRKKKTELEEMPRSKRAARGLTAKFPGLENQVLAWVKERRMAGIGVSTKDIRLKALQIAKEIGILGSFKASVGWTRRFMKRNYLSVRRRTHMAQKLPKDFEEKVIQFQRFIIGKRRNNNYELSQIGNADQTPLTFDIPFVRTIDSVGEKSVNLKTTGNEKNRFTVMLAITGDGNKLPPYVVFKRKTFPKKVKFPKGIYVRVHVKGWFDDDITKDWIKTVWGGRPGGLCGKKGLLVLDAFRCHRDDNTKAMLTQLNTDLAIIPGGLTSMLQPLDVSINMPFKCHMREQWNAWLDGSSGSQSMTSTGRLRKPDLDLVCQWILNAWEKIPSSMVQKSFKKCSITNALDGTEDHLVYETDSEPSDTEGDVMEEEAFNELEVIFNDTDEEDDFNGF